MTFRRGRQPEGAEIAKVDVVIRLRKG